MTRRFTRDELQQAFDLARIFHPPEEVALRVVIDACDVTAVLEQIEARRERSLTHYKSPIPQEALLQFAVLVASYIRELDQESPLPRLEPRYQPTRDDLVTRYVKHLVSKTLLINNCSYLAIALGCLLYDYRPKEIADLGLFDDGTVRHIKKRIKEQMMKRFSWAGLTITEGRRKRIRTTLADDYDRMLVHQALKALTPWHSPHISLTADESLLETLFKHRSPLTDWDRKHAFLDPECGGLERLITEYNNFYATYRKGFEDPRMKLFIPDFDGLPTPPVNRFKTRKLTENEIVLLNERHDPSGPWAYDEEALLPYLEDCGLGDPVVIPQALSDFCHDGNSPNVTFTSESKEELPKLRILYTDFAVWQREWLQAEELEKQVNYWREQLRNESSAREFAVHLNYVELNARAYQLASHLRWLGESSNESPPALDMWAGAGKSYLLFHDLPISAGITIPGYQERFVTWGGNTVKTKQSSWSMLSQLATDNPLVFEYMVLGIRAAVNDEITRGRNITKDFPGDFIDRTHIEVDIKDATTITWFDPWLRRETVGFLKGPMTWLVNGFGIFGENPAHIIWEQWEGFDPDKPKVLNCCWSEPQGRAADPNISDSVLWLHMYEESLLKDKLSGIPEMWVVLNESHQRLMIPGSVEETPSYSPLRIASDKQVDTIETRSRIALKQRTRGRPVAMPCRYTEREHYINLVPVQRSATSDWYDSASAPQLLELLHSSLANATISEPDCRKDTSPGGSFFLGNGLLLEQVRRRTDTNA